MIQIEQYPKYDFNPTTLSDEHVIKDATLMIAEYVAQEAEYVHNGYNFLEPWWLVDAVRPDTRVAEALLASSRPWARPEDPASEDEVDKPTAYLNGGMDVDSFDKSDHRTLEAWEYRELFWRSMGEDSPSQADLRGEFESMREARELKEQGFEVAEHSPPGLFKCWRRRRQA